MGRKNVHVVPRDGGWAVVKEGGDRASKIASTQKEAIQTGREAARKERSELIIHGTDGKIREKDSFGSDPIPPKDKR